MNVLVEIENRQLHASIVARRIEVESLRRVLEDDAVERLESAGVDAPRHHPQLPLCSRLVQVGGEDLVGWVASLQPLDSTALVAAT